MARVTVDMAIDKLIDIVAKLGAKVDPISQVELLSRYWNRYIQQMFEPYSEDTYYEWRDQTLYYKGRGSFVPYPRFSYEQDGSEYVLKVYFFKSEGSSDETFILHYDNEAHHVILLDEERYFLTNAKDPEALRYDIASRYPLKEESAQYYEPYERPQALPHHKMVHGLDGLIEKPRGYVPK